MSKVVKQMLDDKVKDFNKKVNEDASFSKMIEGKNRSICICISDGDNYSSRLENLKLDPFVRTDDEKTDLIVTASAEILEALMLKTMSPVKAYMKGDLKVKASFTDMLLLKRLF